MADDEVLKAITELRAELKSDMLGMEARLREHVQDTETRLREYVHDTETRIVGEFYKWTRPTEARMRSTEVNIGPLIERLGAVEARLLDVEQRINKPL